LETISLNNAPDYVVLSYTWGLPHQNPLHVIHLEETTFPVTESLFTALWHLRPSSPSDAALTIWIDAVCINQSDNLEKAEQVRKMRRIYQLTSQVLIWLGPSANDSEALLDLIARIRQAVDDLGLAGVKMHTMQTMSDDELAETN
jgi:Heterokaryon incompatibility protein (HET)